MKHTDKSKPPIAPAPNFDEIPDELKQCSQWVLWKYVWRNESWTKVPLQPNGESASSTSPETWSTFDSVVLAYNERQGFFSGIGFVFTRESGFVGIDLDNCITWTTLSDGITFPTLDDWAKATVRKLGETYIEYSPSRTGCHFIVKANPKHAVKRPEIEIYAEGRFFTITGDSWGVGEIADATEAVDEIVAALVSTSQESVSDTPVKKPASHLTIEERLSVAFHAENGTKIKTLFEGNWQESYQSQSEADMAMASYLAFYSDGNATLLRQMMESSKLVRQKWEKTYGDGSTYLSRTIDTALKGQTEFFEPGGSLVTIGKRTQTSERSARKYRLLSLGEAAVRDRHDLAAQGLRVGGFSYHELDNIYRPRRKLLSVVVGDPGSGKTTFVLNYLYHLAFTHKLHVGLTAFENSPIDLTHSLVNAHLQKPVFPEFDDCCTDEEYLKALDQIAEHFTVYSPTWDEANCQALSGFWDDSIGAEGLDIVYLDPFSNLQPTDQLLGKYTDFANQQLGFFWNYIQTRSLIGFLLCHPTKNYDRTAGPPKLWNINGSGAFDRCADFGIGIARIDGKLLAEVQKVRHWRTGTMGSEVAWHYDQQRGLYTPTRPPVRKNSRRKKFGF